MADRKYRIVYIVTVAVIAIGFFLFEKMTYPIAAIWAIASIVLGSFVVVEGWRRFFSSPKRQESVEK